MAETLDEAIIENDALEQKDRKTNVELADEWNTSEASVRRHRRAIARNGGVPLDTGVDDFFVDIPSDSITSRGKSVRLPDGSWEKVSWRPGTEAVEEFKRMSYSDIAELLEVDQFISMNHNDDNYRERGTLVISLSDYQAGKRDALGGTPELVKRVTSAYAQIEEYLSRNRYATVIVADCGDSTEGFSNTTQQQQTNDLSLTDQLRTAQALILDAIRRFSRYCDELIYAAVSSNHCAVRTGVGSKNRANSPDDDFGLLIQDNIRQVLDGRPDFAHVKFVHPEKWEEACVVTTKDGTGIGFTHGHLAKSQDKMGEWFANQAFAHRSGLDGADVLLHGHHHNFRVSLTGNNKFVVGSPTMDNGSSWFTNTSGQSSLPGILSFEIGDHVASNWKLWYPQTEGGNE